jgi:hypothetical protein
LQYWKGEKNRVRRSFNPDFFIKIDLDKYISRLESKGKQDNIEKLRKLQDDGMETIIKVVEIKSDKEQDEATPAKEEYAMGHFELVNKKLSILRARSKITSHFKRRCIPPDCVAKARNILIFLRFRALPDGRLNT